MLNAIDHLHRMDGEGGNSDVAGFETVPYED